MILHSVGLGWWLNRLILHLQAPGWLNWPLAPLLIQPPTKAPGKAVEDSQRTWVPVPM